MPESQIFIQPNPFKDKISITTRFNHDFTLVISDPKGKMVYLHTFPANTISINLEQIPVGTYTFKVISNGRSYEEKIVKEI